MSRKVLGIDIRNTSVAAVLVESGLREKRITAHAHRPISGAEDFQGGLQAALQSLAEEIDPAGCDCMVAISADHFSYRNLRIPFKNARKIQLVLPFELEPILPYPADELVIDFIQLSAAGQGDQSDIFAVALPRQRLDPFIEVLSGIDVDPEIITVGGLPAALCLAAEADPGEDRLAIEIGEHSSALFVIAGGQVKLIRSFANPAEAGADRIKVLGSMIRHTLAAYGENADTEFHPLDLVVTGKDSNDDDIEDGLAKILNLPAKALNLNQRLAIADDSPDSRKWNAALLDGALALAITAIEGYDGLNFHRGQFAARKFVAKHKTNLIKSGILAAAVLALLVINVAIESYTLNRQLGRLDQQITGIFKATFPRVKRIQDAYQQMQINVRQAKNNAVLQAETTTHIRSIDILNRISQSIPVSVPIDVSRLVISAETVLISGKTDGFKAVDEIKNQLEKIDFFKKVTISSANIDRSGKEVRFQLKAEL